MTRFRLTKGHKGAWVQIARKIEGLLSELKAEMMRKKPGLLQILNKKLRTVEALRGQLWKEYLQTHLSAF